jgi:hypothetical protein
MIPLVLSILSGAGATVLVALLAGLLLLRYLQIRLRRWEEPLLGFVVGSACLSLLVFLLAACGQARAVVMQICGAAIVAVWVVLRRRGFWRGVPASPGPEDGLPLFWKVMLAGGFAVFAVLYVLAALGPVWSQSGTSGTLSLVARYARDHALSRPPTNLLADLPQGMEMLFLFAYPLGGYPAAALVHCAFLLVLPFLAYCYAQRIGHPRIGVFGALLTFASPIVGFDGSTTSHAVALAAVLFSAFMLLYVWRSEQQQLALIPAGLLAGFAIAIAYRGFLGLVLALATVVWPLWRNRQPLLRPALVLTASAALTCAPWLVKNFVFTGNPVSPFFSNTLPGVSVNAAVEQEFSGQRDRLSSIGPGIEIPFDLAITGKSVDGLVGPVFLLAPFVLLACRRREARPLALAAAVFALPLAADLSAFSLIPSLPFMSLSLGLAFADTPLFVPLVAAHLVASYPNVVALYCSPETPRVRAVSLSVALHRRSEDVVLNARLPGYSMVRQIEALTPPGARVFSMHAMPEAYTTRDIVVWNRGAINLRLAEALRIALLNEAEPTHRIRLRFQADSYLGFRISAASNVAEDWRIHELRFFSNDKELPRAYQWELRASSNPHEIQSAFDNSPVTFWSGGAPTNEGMNLIVRFGKPAAVDSILIETSPSPEGVPVLLDVLGEDGSWWPQEIRTEEADSVRSLVLRRLAMREFQAQGVDYLLARDTDFFARDIQQMPDIWGVTEIAASGGTRFYRIR